MTTAIADRRDSLHVLGHDVSGATSTYDALDAHGLTGWNLRVEQTFLADGRPVPDGRSVVADIDGRTGVPLGAVGRTYSPVQTEDFAGLLDTLGRESGAKLDIVTTLNGGKRVMVGLKLPEPIAVGGFDQIDVSLCAIINHVTGANRLSVVPFRLFCANQQPAISRDGDELFTLRHTTNAAARLDNAGQLLTAAGSRLAHFQESSEQMLRTPLSEQEFLSRTAKLFPKGGEKQSGVTRFENRQARLRRLFVEDATQEGIRFTAWGGYQAVIEYVDHEMSVRKGRNEEPGTDYTVAQRRAMRSLSGQGTALKLSALAAFAPDPTAVGFSAN